MPPTNVSFATALELGALPVNTSQSDINDAGVNFTVFYKFTAPAGITMVWAWIKSGNTGSGYRPSVTPYDNAQVEILSPNPHIPADIPNRHIQFPVTPGQNYYLQAVKNVDSVGPEALTILVRTVPNESAIPLESIIVNGDLIGQPCGVHSPSIDYQTIKFVPGVAFGEGGCITSTGRILFDNRNLADKKIVLYDSNLNELGSDTILAFAWIRNNRATGFFWVLVLENAGFSKLYKVNPNVLPLAKTLVATLTGHGNATAISVNSAETIAYFYGSSALNQPIKRWDLTLDVAMTDLVASEGATFFVLDTLYLQTLDLIVVAWSDNTNNFARIKTYNTSGVLQNTVQFDSFEEQYGSCRLALSPDGPSSFWVKLREISIPGSAGVPTGRSKFVKLRTSDLTTLVTRYHLEYSGRNYIGPEAASLPGNGESGAWNSCPFVVAQTGLPPGPSGIYKIVTDRRNDNNIAIPAPTFKTALMP
jgi:hypothetical protein